MTTADLVRLHVFDGVAHITLNRPDSLNAISLQLAVEFGRIVDSLSDRGDVRAIVIDGEGPHFCAGGDVIEMVAAVDRGAMIGELAQTIHRGLIALAALPVVVITAVRGAVRGAGVGLSLSGDIIVAGSTTTFRPAYSGVGLSPDCGLTVLLPSAIGLPRALKITVLDQILTATEAHSFGMVAEVVDDAQVTAHALEIAQMIANGPARALGETRRLMRAGMGHTYDEGVTAEGRAIAARGNSDESRERVERFAARSSSAKR